MERSPRHSREEDEERSLPPCYTGASEDADIEQIIKKAEDFINTYFDHKVKEGIITNNRRAFQRSCSQDLASSLETDNLKGLLRTEIPAATLKKLESDILPGVVSEDTCVEEADGTDINIHTVHFKPREETDSPDAPPTPLVMIHGLGGSVVSFHQNFQKLSEGRDVYGIDLPGFGLSSREADLPSCTTHSNDDITEELVLQCEDRVVELVEKWRHEKQLEEMILLGHSFGGYMAAVYAMKYPERVRHLVMVDPWGMLTKEETKKVSPDVYKKNNFAIRLAMALSQRWHLKPFDIPRAGGHTIGVLIMQVAVKKSQKEAYGNDAMKYFVDVNSRLPTGEKLFSILSGYTYMFPVVSIKSRLLCLPNCPPTTFIYGSNPAFSTLGGKMLQECMADKVTVVQIPGTDHHVHAENPDGFHAVMMEVFGKVDHPTESPPTAPSQDN